MARKKGDKNSDTDLKAAEALKMKMETDKTHEQIAEELGVTHSTVSRRIQKALSTEEVQNSITTSRNRLIQMLSRCDEAYLDILSLRDPANFGNRAKVATSIYKTFGLIQDETQIKVQNIMPIQVTIQDPAGERAYVIAPKTGE